MLQNISLPKPLVEAIASESKDFVVKGERAYPLKKSIPFLLFGLGWTVFSGVFVALFFGPLFFGQEVHFTSNGVPTVASPDNLEPLLFPGIIIGVFLLIGFGMIGVGIFKLFKKGGYFVSTPTRLIQYRKGNIKSTDWEQFSGNIEVNHKGNKGNITLELRTGKMVKRKNAPSRYVPDIIYIAGIPNVFRVEQICRQRIKENDPTPSQYS